MHIDLVNYLALYHWDALGPDGTHVFRPWQLITHIFMHANLSHIFFNMFGLWMFGSIIENRFGSKRFLQLYIISGLGAALCHLGVISFEASILHNLGAINSATIGASGAVYGVLFAFGFLYPNTMVQLYFFIPVKAKWVIVGLAALDLFGGISNSGSDNIAHFAHLGGMLAAFILFKFWHVRYNSG